MENLENQLGRDRACPVSLHRTNVMSDKFQNKYRISSARASWWDYDKNGIYFVTICTKVMVNYFWDILPEPSVSVETRHALSLQYPLSEIGKQARQFWLDIPSHFPFVALDEFVIMPNHLHGIILIDKPDDDGKFGNIVDIVEKGHALSLPTTTITTTIRTTPAPHRRFRNQGKNTVSAIVGSFKSAVTNWCNKNGNAFGWQSRFHDHIIRTDGELDRIREYIINNPANWINDKFNNNRQ